MQDKNAYSRAYYQTHKGYYVNYAKKNKGRIDDRIRSKRFLVLAGRTNLRNKTGKITAFDLWKIAKRQKCKCALTGIPLTSENMSVDHIQPRSRGGLNIPSNIRLTIRIANIAKHQLLDQEFYTLCKQIVGVYEQRVHCKLS